MPKARIVQKLMQHVHVYTVDHRELDAHAVGQDQEYFSRARKDAQEQLNALPERLLQDMGKNPRRLAIGIMSGYDGGMRAWETDIFTRHGAYPRDIQASAFYLTNGLRMGGGRYIQLKDAPGGLPYSGAIGINWFRAEEKRTSPQFGPDYGRQYPIIHEIAHHWLIDCPSCFKQDFLQKFTAAIEKDKGALSSSMRAYISSLSDAHDAEQDYFAFCLEMACGGQRKLYPTDNGPLFDFEKAPNIKTVLAEYFPDLALFQQQDMHGETGKKGLRR